MTIPHIEIPASLVKTELDRLELIERVPVLRREATRTESRLDERGFPMLVVIPPRHPAVIAYINERAALIREKCTDLKAARRNLKDAFVNYRNRVNFRVRSDIALSRDEELGPYADFAKFISLSSIIEARAEAIHWRKVILKLETDRKIRDQKEQNRRNINRHRLRSMGLAC